MPKKTIQEPEPDYFMGYISHRDKRWVRSKAFWVLTNPTNFGKNCNYRIQIWLNKAHYDLSDRGVAGGTNGTYQWMATPMKLKGSKKHAVLFEAPKIKLPEGRRVSFRL